MRNTLQSMNYFVTCCHGDKFIACKHNLLFGIQYKKKTEKWMSFERVGFNCALSCEEFMGQLYQIKIKTHKLKANLHMCIILYNRQKNEIFDNRKLNWDFHILLLWI